MGVWRFDRDEGSRRGIPGNVSRSDPGPNDARPRSLWRGTSSDSDERRETKGQEEDSEDELRNQPLLDSMRSLVNKERQLAELELEEKEREANLWRQKFLELQQEVGEVNALPGDNDAAVGQGMDSRLPEQGTDDWENLQAASRTRGDMSLRILKKLHGINLSRRNMGALELDGAVSKLKWLRNCTSVDLSNNCLDDACQQSLRILMSLRQLHVLDLRANYLGPVAGAAVIASLSRCRNLEELQLDANMALASSPGVGAHLAAGLRAAIKAGGCKKLSTLTVTLNDFDNKTNSLSTLHLSTARKKQGEEIDTPTPRSAPPGPTPAPKAGSKSRRRILPVHPMNAFALVRAFHPRAPGGGVGATLLKAGNGKQADSGAGGDRTRGRHGVGGVRRGGGGCGIASLGLPYAKLHPRTVCEIALHVVPCLTHLNLSYCYVGPAGAAALARALDGSDFRGDVGDGGVGRRRGSLSLRSLQLPHNAIGDSGACALGVALINNRCLTSLNLASNCIGHAGGHALAKAIEKGWGEESGMYVGGGGGGVTVARLDVGDNPLGETSAGLLVTAATGRESDDGGVAGGVQILGLDRVVGATVAMRESARKVNLALDRRRTAGAASSTALIDGEDAEGQTDSDLLGMAVAEVSVRPEDCTSDDGFVQVYQICLSDSNASQPSVAHSRPTSGDASVVLDICWSYAPAPSTFRGKSAATAADLNAQAAWPWRICRGQEGGLACFIVKEWLESERYDASSREHEALPADEGGREDGYSSVRVVCNGWRTTDVLKIFVRLSGRALRCRGLKVRRVPDDKMISESYGVLWADADWVSPVACASSSVGCQRHWRGQESPRGPTNLEKLQVARQLSQRLSKERDTIHGTINADDCESISRVRQVHIGMGGHIRASLEAKVFVGSKGIHRAQRHVHTNGNLAGGAGKMGGGRDGYVWAIVRTRGGDGVSVAMEVHDATMVPAVHPVYPPKVVYVGHVRALGSKRVDGKDVEYGRIGAGFPGNAPAPSSGDDGGGLVTMSETRACASEWHRLEADTCGWLPGDNLSLWMTRTSDHRHQYYTNENQWEPTKTAVEWNNPDPAAAATQPFGNTHAFSPIVRDFVLRAVDDAVQDEIASRARIPSGGTSSKTGHERINGDNAPRVTATKIRVIRSTTVATGKSGAESMQLLKGGGTDSVVRLDFASVSPMNMAAAGGSWA